MAPIACRGTRGGCCGPGPALHAARRGASTRRASQRAWCDRRRPIRGRPARKACRETRSLGRSGRGTGSTGSGPSPRAADVRPAEHEGKARLAESLDVFQAGSVGWIVYQPSQEIEVIRPQAAIRPAVFHKHTFRSDGQTRWRRRGLVHGRCQPALGQRRRRERDALPLGQDFQV